MRMFKESNFTDEQKDQMFIEILKLRQTLNSMGLILSKNIQITLDVCKNSHIKIPDEGKLVDILSEIQGTEGDFLTKIEKLSQLVDFFKEENRGRVYQKNEIPEKIKWW